MAYIISDRVRVTEDDLQWIVELRHGRWRPKHFCRQRESLLRILRRIEPGCSLEEIERLPDWHHEQERPVPLSPAVSERASE